MATEESCEHKQFYDEGPVAFGASQVVPAPTSTVCHWTTFALMIAFVCHDAVVACFCFVLSFSIGFHTVLQRVIAFSVDTVLFS